MNDRAFPLDRLRVASPCPADWNNMTGDERVRFCAECSLNVYNVSAMSRDEAEAFIAKTEGRICIKFYSRADGTVLTRDCPVGVKITRRRRAKVATAAFAAVMSVAASASAQGSSQTGTGGAVKGSQQTAASTMQTQQQSQRGLSGNIVDVRGIPVAGVKVEVFNESAKRKETAVTNEKGEFQFPALKAGLYTLKARADGFNAFEWTGIEVFSDKPANVNITMQPKGLTVTVGIYVGREDFSISQGTTTIKLPN